ncbi:hypothetical protein LDC_2008 [sediment metagenome]|uniref:Uncharacterized protein n=1 Tax=sediment metagenome TaxID=749907 RepID=D9PKE3_9ZZZZ
MNTEPADAVLHRLVADLTHTHTVQVRPERLDALRTERDAALLAQRAAAARRAQRLAAARNYGVWLASERLDWQQIQTVAARARSTLGPQRPSAALGAAGDLFGLDWLAALLPADYVSPTYDAELVDSLIQGIAAVHAAVESAS